MSDDNDDDGIEERNTGIEDHTVASRQRIRNQLNDEIAEFLARGGKIQVMDSNVRASPPQMQVSEFNSLPI